MLVLGQIRTGTNIRLGEYLSRQVLCQGEKGFMKLRCEKCGKTTDTLMPLYTKNLDPKPIPYDLTDCMHGEYFDPQKFIEKYSKKDLEKYYQIEKQNNQITKTMLCKECYEK